MFPALRTTFPAVMIFAIAATSPCRAQFLDSFEEKKIAGWFFYTGDGSATMEFVPQDGFARIQVDGSQDKYNVWWAIIKRDVSSVLNVQKLQDPAYELRVEARVRGSHAPRRVNFMINTQRTTNFHEHLREYDLPDTTGWHTISMTTRNFDVKPGDNIFVQLGVTDWGPGQYHVDVDYYRADVVRVDEAGPDVGEPLVYHPPAPAPATYGHHLAVTHDALINADFPDVNFNDWHVADADGTARILTVDASQSAILRWDFSAWRGRQVDGAGLLDLTTYSVPQGGKYIEHFGEDLGIEFGKIRVIEILAGDPNWDQHSVTYHSLLHGQDPTDVFNSQMIFDAELAEQRGGKNAIVLPRPVMQRLLEGKTKGLVIRPLGALVASVYASEDQGADRSPTLHFSTKP